MTPARNPKPDPDPIEEPDVGVNIPMPESLHRQLKIAAATDGTTQRAIIVEAVRAWLANR